MNIDQDSCRNQPYDSVEDIATSDLLLANSDTTPERNAPTPELFLTESTLKMFDDSVEKLLNPVPDEVIFQGPSMDTAPTSSNGARLSDVFAVYQNVDSTMKWVNSEKVGDCFDNMEFRCESPNTQHDLNLAITRSLDEFFQLDKTGPPAESTDELVDTICADMLTQQDWTQIASPVMNWDVAERYFSPVNTPPLSTFSDLCPRQTLERKPSIEIISAQGKRAAPQSGAGPAKKTHRVAVPSRKQLMLQKRVQGYFSSLGSPDDGQQSRASPNPVGSGNLPIQTRPPGSQGAPAAEACPGATERWRKQQKLNGSGGVQQNGGGPPKNLEAGSNGGFGSNEGTDFASAIENRHEIEVVYQGRIPIDPPILSDAVFQSLVDSSIGANGPILSTLLQKYPDYCTTIELDDAIIHNYQFRAIGNTLNLNELFDCVLATERWSFRMNISFVRLLYNQELDEYRVFYRSSNSHRALTRAIHITNDESIARAREQLSAIDMAHEMTKGIPDSKWISIMILGVCFEVDSLRGRLIGANTTLPTHVSNSRHLMNFTYHNRNKLQFQLCVFRCIVQAKYGHINKQQVKTYFERYCTAKAIYPNASKFPGVLEEDIPLIEQLFDVNLNIYCLNSDRTVTPLRYCLPDDRRVGPVININVCTLHDNTLHYSLIMNLSKLSNQFNCSGCGRYYTSTRWYERHLPQCNGGKSERVFPGGFYKYTKNIFERLDAVGICVPEELRHNPYFAVTDFESMLKPMQVNYQRSRLEANHPDDVAMRQALNDNNIAVEDVDDATMKLQWMQEHQPISFAICSTVPGHQQPTCTVKENPDDLIKEFVAELTSISVDYKDVITQLLADYIDQLKAKIQIVEQNVVDWKAWSAEKMYYKLLERLRIDIEAYCSQLTVLTFNGGSYDIPLILKHMIPEIAGEQGSAVAHTIKKDGSYMALSTSEFRFLDVRNYLAPGYSLDKFMQAYEAGSTKMPFPYSFLDSWVKLEYLGLPPKNDFYSSVKGSGISDHDYDKAKQIFRDHNCKTFGDYLKIYNVNDVVPFLKACQKMMKFYMDQQKIDIFRDAMALPGVCMKYLFRDTKYRFGIFNDDQAKYHDLMRHHLHGGFTCIMNRFAEAGSTYIKGNLQKPVKSVIGYDMNGMYLGAFGGKLPTGQPIIWERKGDIFEKQNYMPIANVWLEYMEVSLNHKIEFGLMNKGEAKVTEHQIRVDGLYEKGKTVFQFHGCHYHLHYGCPKLSTSIRSEQNGRSIIQVNTATDMITGKLEAGGYTVISIFECEFETLVQSDQNVRAIVEKIKYRFHSHKRVGADRMIDAIKSGEVYGFAVASMHCPESLKAKFNELLPFYKKTLITRDDVGPHMKQFCDITSQLKQPRMSLIHSYFCVDELLVTDMIDWYLSQGMVLDNIKTVIQYRPGEPFKDFANWVTQCRIQGDLDPNTKIRAETAKLNGNTGYGKTITNIDKHTQVTFMEREPARKKISDPQFKGLSKVTDGYYEVEMFKKKTGLLLAHPNWPGGIYDIKTVTPQVDSTDTDSAYVALSGDSLESVVRPELRDEYNRVKHNWMVDPTCPNSLRQPGLMKIEQAGNGIVALAPKSYIAYTIESDGSVTNMKRSTKGVSKVTNTFLVDHFKNVLFSKNPRSGFNVGIRRHPKHKQPMTYVQQRQALSYCYIKRKVGADGISTTPLDL